MVKVTADDLKKSKPAYGGVVEKIYDDYREQNKRLVKQVCSLSDEIAALKGQADGLPVESDPDADEASDMITKRDLAKLFTAINVILIDFCESVTMDVKIEECDD